MTTSFEFKPYDPISQGQRRPKPPASVSKKRRSATTQPEGRDHEASPDVNVRDADNMNNLVGAVTLDLTHIEENDKMPPIEELCVDPTTSATKGRRKKATPLEPCGEKPPS